ncbi:hypothetical protein LguiB_018469 [Lonicera macranthoides]
MCIRTPSMDHRAISSGGQVTRFSLGLYLVFCDGNGDADFITVFDMQFER